MRVCPVPVPFPLRLLAGCLFGLWLLPAPAFAQDVAREEKRVVAAAKAFTQAQEAELQGDHARAAELFEMADRIAPTPEALRSATRSRLHAGELAAAARHAEELLRRYRDDASSRELAAQVLNRARPELTRYRLQCGEPCTVVVDGLANGVTPLDSQILYATPGSHEFEVSFEGGRERGMRLSGGRGEALSIRVRPPPAEKLTSSEAPSADASPQPVGASPRLDTARVSRRLSPLYFWSAASLTAVAGGLAIWSGIDLLHTRDDFESSSEPTRAQFERGEQKDLRTNVLLGGTAALLASTAVLAWFTDFGRDRRAPSARVDLTPGGALLQAQTAF